MFFDANGASFGFIGDFLCFFNAIGASVYRASLARQQGIVVAGCKSSSLKIRRISLLKATRSALKIEMIFGMIKKCCKKSQNPCPYLFISLLINRKNHYKVVFLFLHYTLRMRKVINGSMQNVSLSGERGGPSKMVESRFLFVGIRESKRMLHMAFL